MNNAQYAVTIKAHSTAKVQATMDGNAGSGLIRPDPTPFDNTMTVTAESILGEMMDIIGNYNNGISSTFSFSYFSLLTSFLFGNADLTRLAPPPGPKMESPMGRIVLAK